MCPSLVFCFSSESQKFAKSNDCHDNNESYISHHHVVVANVLAISDEEPPDGDHGPVLLAQVLVIVEHTRHMTVAIVAANVVHTLPISAISTQDIVVELGKLALLDVEGDVLVRLTKGKVILTDEVGSSEIMDDTISTADASVPDHG